ncbi:MAG TPA: glycosyltransferase 87 family protein [Candidatus Limnocylindria bacterium]|nr:glycosyltransferase 87 family protein [Candidatus Limnocylindria bacterium]
MPRVERIARFLVTALVLGWLAYTLTSWFLAWNPADARAYYLAAERLRDGEPLYPSMHPDAHEVFRYAPWFAVVFLPFTVLPIDVATHLWSVLMLCCAVLAVIPVARLGGRAAVALSALLGALLAETAMFGNAHPLVVALLSWTIVRPSAPWWVGAATSIKLAPIGFILPWLGMRRVRDAVIAVGVAALLFAPMLAFDLSGYVTTPGTGLVSPYAASPLLWLAGAGVAAIAVVWLSIRASPYAYVAAGAAMFLVPPRVSTAYMAFLLPATIAALREVRDRRQDG